MSVFFKSHSLLFSNWSMTRIVSSRSHKLFSPKLIFHQHSFKYKPSVNDKDNQDRYDVKLHRHHVQFIIIKLIIYLYNINCINYSQPQDPLLWLFIFSLSSIKFHVKTLFCSGDHLGFEKRRRNISISLVVKMNNC